MMQAGQAIEPTTISIAGLSKRYGGTVALDDVTFALAPGSIHAILGENGSGKSTLVKLLSGIIAPSRGTILIGDQPIAGLDPLGVQSLGLATVFQEVLLAPDRSVADNILLGMGTLFGRRAARAERHELAAAALARITRTPIDLDAAAGTLSLATSQLVVLARALARNPRILVLDEVTAALDLTDREAVFEMMEAHARAGGLILFISHRMDEVLRLADRVTILRSGKLVDTLERPAVTAELLLRLMAPAAARELGHGA
jgi:ribose transport system ATP-binding protein